MTSRFSRLRTPARIHAEHPQPSERELRPLVHTLALRDALDAAAIRMLHVPTADNVADPLTKPTSVRLLDRFLAVTAP